MDADGGTETRRRNDEGEAMKQSQTKNRDCRISCKVGNESNIIGVC